MENVCTKISLSPDKWEKVILHFAVTTENGGTKEETIELPRVTITKTKDRKTGEIKESRVNAFQNGRFTTGFRKKATNAATEKYYPQYLDDCKAIAKACASIRGAARDVTDNPLAADQYINKLRVQLMAMPAFTLETMEAWLFYCSTDNRLKMFGGEAADQEDNED